MINITPANIEKIVYIFVSEGKIAKFVFVKNHDVVGVFDGDKLAFTRTRAVAEIAVTRASKNGPIEIIRY